MKLLTFITMCKSFLLVTFWENYITSFSTVSNSAQILLFMIPIIEFFTNKFEGPLSTFC
jgi:hypothetical protein